MRILFFRILLFVFLGLALFLYVTFIRRLILKKQSQSLNIILISIDALRADHMGIYGYKKDTTPNIDKWAKNATVFTNANTVVPMTYPSFVALMTGQNPLKTRITNNSLLSSPKPWEPWVNALPLSDNIKTLPKILKEKGYFNVAFMSTPALNNKSNINKGFDHYENFDWGKDTAEASVNTALDLLDKNKNKKIFFWIHLLDPHSPYTPPEDLKCKFNPKYCNLKGTDQSLEIERNSYVQQLTKDCNSYNTIPQDKKEIFKMLYDGEITFSDGLVKMILDKLSEIGLDKNSLIVLYGDHGEGFDHEVYFEHGSNVYQSNIRTPLIIKYPLIKATDIRINRLIQNTDIFPTLLDLLGISTKDKVDGKSFSDIFYGDIFSIFNFNKRKNAYSINSSMTKFSIVNDHYKYIYNYKTCAYKNYNEELYDLDKDSEEMSNIVDSKKDIATRLNNELMDYLSRYNLPQDHNRQNLNYTNKEIEQLKSLGY
jgi:arylsulfatase A-like enzyme